MSKYLVTGSAGFIGTNIVLHLLNEGHEVVGLDDLSNGTQENLDAAKAHSNFTFIKGTITDLDTCRNACEGCDYVLHHAALGSVPESIEKPLLYNETNVTGTLNMLTAAAENNIKRFVYATSSAVYGDSPILPKIETLRPEPKSPYATSKITNEYYAKIFSETKNLETVGLRYFNVYGPRQNPHSEYSAVIPKFISSFLKSESPTIYGDGEQTRDFIFIKDIINANLNACNIPGIAGQTFNIGGGESISLNTLATELQALTNANTPAIHAPERQGDIKDSVADISAATSVGLITNPTPLTQGLKETIQWFND